MWRFRRSSMSRGLVSGISPTLVSSQFKVCAFPPPNLLAVGYTSPRSRSVIRHCRGPFDPPPPPPSSPRMKEKPGCGHPPVITCPGTSRRFPPFLSAPRICYHDLPCSQNLLTLHMRAPLRNGFALFSSELSLGDPMRSSL